MIVGCDVLSSFAWCLFQSRVRRLDAASSRGRTRRAYLPLQRWPVALCADEHNLSKVLSAARGAKVSFDT